jgi:hypothetical protein
MKTVLLSNLRLQRPRQVPRAILCRAEARTRKRRGRSELVNAYNLHVVLFLDEIETYVLFISKHSDGEDGPRSGEDGVE